ncbi:hypothetical protein [Cohnella sp. JJ-181]|uniref:hypothetical protein n=1 Tax=Cohnella rhizoplanae TaxID=2974897 RepID=UPI0022FF6516|nr:hypothetical protein [Cohnella sp. JJ-181]CAI6086086.1 hypothetical protein COHCIP112018_04914 [Cohnella sp. JJ-181]
MKKAGFRALMLVTLLALVFQSTPTNANAATATYAERLYSPMFITKLSGLYFIADSWNHRLIYSSDVNTPIKNWKVLDDDIAAPHSIASNGTIFISEDTGRDRLFVYTLTTKGFAKTQVIDNIKGRPHRTVYDQATRKFYVLTSDTQNMYTLSVKNGRVVIDSKKHLPYMEASYVRSFSIIDGLMYFVSGPNQILAVNYKDGTFSLREKYDVPAGYRSMNDLKKIGNYYYITVYYNKFIRLKDLSDFSTAEDLYTKLGFKGVPYYMSYIDGKVYVTEIDTYSAIRSFKVLDDQISMVQVKHDYGAPNAAVLNRKRILGT